MRRETFLVCLGVLAVLTAASVAGGTVGGALRPADHGSEVREKVGKLVATRKRKKAKKDRKGPFIDLQGRWRENQRYRTGLNDVLYQLGMPWWKRLYVTSTSWENEQTIFQKGNVFRINGFKGPQAEVYSHVLTTDNSTVSTVSMGTLGGGALNAIAFVESKDKKRKKEEAEEEENGEEGEGEDLEENANAPSASLVAMLTNRDTGKLELIQKRTRKKGSKMMVEETTHVASGTILRTVYFKQ